MRNRNLVGVFIIVFIDLIVLFLIVFLLQNLLKTLKIRNMRVKYPSQLKKETYFHPENERLKYYYESMPDNTYSFQLEWLPGEITYNINSDGLNERYNYPVVKKDNIFRIITLGD